MPVYIFRCRACDLREERFVSMADRNDVKCPNCKRAMNIVIAPVGLSSRRSTEGKGRSA